MVKQTDSEVVLAEPEAFVFTGPQDDEPSADYGFNEPPPERVKPTDPTMDPGDNRWNPKKYFDAQPKEIIQIVRTESDILHDPSGKIPQFVPVSINGYVLNIQKGVPTRVPRDFALLLIDSGAAMNYAEIPTL